VFFVAISSSTQLCNLVAAMPRWDRTKYLGGCMFSYALRAIDIITEEFRDLAYDQSWAFRYASSVESPLARDAIHLKSCSRNARDVPLGLMVMVF